MTPLPVTARESKFAALRTPVDVLVIGGGVNGLAIAWDAALAGRRVVVVDKGDWGSGTSSWSSRMIHGGLKYLEKYDVRLVRESLRDREWLLRNASHLVQPLPFLLPFYRGNAHSAAALRAGMIAYDVLSFDKSVPWHRTFSRDALLERLPGLAPENLQGGARYYDAQVEYAERLCVELMLAARNAGALTLNHTRASELTLSNGTTVTGATLVDELTGTRHQVEAALTINVSGAWADTVLAGTPADERRWIGGTKGTHLVVDRFPGAPDDAMYYESVDARPMMVIPWLGRYLLGSTDKHVDGDLDTIAPDAAEVAYILYETNRVLPCANLTHADVHYGYTGVRPLPYVGSGKTADISRRHEIHDHAPQVEGLLSVIGGKLTTFRALAAHACRVISTKIGPTPSTLGLHRLPGALTRDRITGETGRTRAIYGGRSPQLLELAGAEPRLAHPLDEEVIAAEVAFAVRREEAVHLADVMARRIMTALRPDLGRSLAEPVAEVMAAELGWDDDQREREIAEYHRYLERFAVPEPDPAFRPGQQ
ncbi:MAG: FAD-dependent oxidoreductase [Actinomycetales bacterium]